MRIAISGGAGFIGSHTVDVLAARGDELLLIDDHSHAADWRLPDGVTAVVADCASDVAADAINSFRPEAALHLASKGGVQKASRDPAAHVRASVASSVGFLDIAIRAGVRRLVTASSGGTIYGDAAMLPAGENLPPAPMSVYGAAKLAEEGYLAALGRRHGVATLALRYGNVYGPRQDGTGEAGVVAISCQRLAEGVEPIIHGDGEQTRDFVFVSDVARANVAALCTTFGGILNIGTGRQTSVREIVDLLIARSNRHVAAEHDAAKDGEVRNVWLDSAEATKRLDWKAEVGIREGLDATWSWFCKRPSRLVAGS